MITLINTLMCISKVFRIADIFQGNIKLFASNLSLLKSDSLNQNNHLNQPLMSFSEEWWRYVNGRSTFCFLQCQSDHINQLFNVLVSHKIITFINR